MSSHYEKTLQLFRDTQDCALAFGHSALIDIAEGKTIRQMSIDLCGNNGLEDRIGRWIMAAEWDIKIAQKNGRLYEDVRTWLTPSHFTVLWQIYKRDEDFEHATDLMEQTLIRNVRKQVTEYVPWYGSLREVFVDWTEEGGLTERELDPVAGVEETAARYGAAPEDGDESEICLDAAPMMRALAGTIHRGVLFIVDYGYPASELYSAGHRRGTLLAYHRHAAGEDYLHRVGQQDLTAHVNFTQIEDAAREAGLTVLGLTTQDRFLIGNGILDHFRSDAEAAWRDPSRVRRRLQAMRLIHPSGMGRTFKVLVLSKGLAPPPSLAGLRDPFDFAERFGGF